MTSSVGAGPRHAADQREILLVGPDCELTIADVVAAAHRRRTVRLTSANQEDHVSMGATSALHLRIAVGFALQVLAIEALCAAQGLDFIRPAPAIGVAAAHRLIRDEVPHLSTDRPPAPDIEAVAALIGSGRLLQRASDATA